MSQERRGGTRAPCIFPVRCRLAQADAPWRDVQTVNVSAGGLRYLGQESFETGTVLEVQVIRPYDGEVVPVRGTVVWTTSPAAGVVETGVQFEPLTPAQRQRIEELVQRLMRGSGMAP